MWDLGEGDDGVAAVGGLDLDFGIAGGPRDQVQRRLQSHVLQSHALQSHALR